jgi:hypothetical protein
MCIYVCLTNAQGGLVQHPANNDAGEAPAPPTLPAFTKEVLPQHHNTFMVAFSVDYILLFTAHTVRHITAEL